MLNSRKQICASRDKKNKYSNSCVVREKNSERNKKNITPSPLQVKWSVPKTNCDSKRCNCRKHGLECSVACTECRNMSACEDQDSDSDE